MVNRPALLLSSFVVALVVALPACAAGSSHRSRSVTAPTAATTPIAGPPAHGAATRWVASWSAPPDRPGPSSGGIPDLAGTGGVTVRDVVHTTLGGPELRVRLATGAALPTTVAGSSRRIGFAGAEQVTVPAGGVVASDPVKLPVRAGQDVAISIYAPGSTGTVTIAGRFNHTNYVSGPGDLTAATTATSFPVTSPAWYWLDGVDVAARDPDAGAVVALGDSITAGFDSTEKANAGRDELLGDRLP